MEGGGRVFSHSNIFSKCLKDARGAFVFVGSKKTNRKQKYLRFCYEIFFVDQTRFLKLLLSEIVFNSILASIDSSSHRKST